MHQTNRSKAGLLRAGDRWRYAARPRAANRRKDATKISSMHLGLCDLDGLLYNRSEDKFGRSS